MLSRVAIFVIRVYQAVISPLMPPSCRYLPTCSQYMIEAVERFGPARGIWLGMKRIGRCHPFHAGGFDPVPERDALNSEKIR